jgi:hypothetical protein
MDCTPDRRRAGGARVTLLLGLVLVAAAAGAWNYRRNLAAEEAERARRPLSGYSVPELDALAEAYRSEVAQLSRRYDSARGQRVATREQGFFGDQIDEYERVRRASGERREAGAELGETEAALRDVEAELATRGSEGGTTWQIHLRRLLTF